MRNPFCKADAEWRSLPPLHDGVRETEETLRKNNAGEKEHSKARERIVKCWSSLRENINEWLLKRKPLRKQTIPEDNRKWTVVFEGQLGAKCDP